MSGWLVGYLVGKTDELDGWIDRWRGIQGWSKSTQHEHRLLRIAQVTAHLRAQAMDGSQVPT
jgi:hypothetical protein